MSTQIDDKIQLAIADIKEICEREGSKSQYFSFGGEGYKSCVRHYFESSTEVSAGAVQPGSNEDLSAIVQVIAEHKVPFAVKCGGHATNPGFSSTKGIQISMCRFNKIRLEKHTKSFLPADSTEISHSIVHIGAGCLFDEVYREVVPHGLNIVGGSSIGGVGIAGWLLGGGYSLKTNQHGLGIDNILQVAIVLPNGDIKKVNNQSKGDDKLLFEVIKGGGNNFGIVTEFTVRAHKQTKPTCGCLLQYEVEDFEEVKTAVVNFSRDNSDPKASIVAAFRYFCSNGGIQAKLTVQCFYDGPRPEDDLPFAELLSIDHTAVDGGGDTVGWQEPSNAPVSRQVLRSAPRSVPKQSGLVEYSDYHAFDHQTSLVNGVLDTQDIAVDKIEPPPPPAHGYTDVVEADTMARSLDLKEAPTSAKVLRITVTEPMARSLDLNAAPRSMKVLKVVGANTDSPVKVLEQQSKSYIKRAMVGVGENPRGRWGNVMVDVYTKEIVDEIARQASKSAREMPGHGGKRVVIDIWPFTTGMFDNATRCAWPHVRGERNGPILAYFLWEGPENDAFWIKQMQRALKAIKKKVDKARGPDAQPLPVYQNTTLDTTLVEDIYGTKFEGLMDMRAKFDPDLVMNLTGGFKIPHPIGPLVRTEAQA